MLFVGIDVASKKHDVIITDQNGNTITKPFTIFNNIEGFEKLRKEIISHTESHNDVHIGIEETGIYSKNIAEFLALYGFTIHMINPVLTNHSRKAHSLRVTKTDKVDALVIAKYIEHNFKRLNSYTPSLYIESELKALARARYDILKKQVKAKTEWTRILDLIFPEFRCHFNQHSKWVHLLFYNYPSTNAITRMHFQTLINIIKIKGDRVAAANTIKHLAKVTIGNTSNSNSVLLLNTLDDIIHYSKQLKRIEKQMSLIMNKHFQVLLTIPGVGKITGATIIGEIGNIRRFHSPKALVAFAGLDPTVYESGNFKSNNSHISKHGSKYLRSAVFIATRGAIINTKISNNKFRQKYHKKISQGKHHNSAICSATKNMLNVIYAILLTNQPYDYSF